MAESTGLHPALTTDFCRLTGARFPIVQTGMGYVAVPALAAATTNAGGLGFLAGATLAPDDLAPAIVEVKRLTSGAFGVNFLMDQPNAAQVVDSVIEHGVRVVGYHRSPNPRLIRRLKDAGVVCMPTVGALRHARKAIDLGADALIAQGAEGGGHTGAVPTSLLLPQITSSVDVPVMAAGGFQDGRGLVAALAYGAAGIAMGTRFLLTSDSPVGREAKSRYLAAGVTDTIVTAKVDGLPQRLLVNEFVSRLERRSGARRMLLAARSARRYQRLSGATTRQLIRAGAAMRRSDGLRPSQVLLAANAPVLVRRALFEGDVTDGIMPTGQVAGLIQDLPSCEALIQQIVTSADEVLSRLSTQTQATVARGSRRGRA